MTADSPEARQALARLDALCAAYPEVTSRPSHHTPTFFIRDRKVFCHLWDDHHGDGRLALWCPAAGGVQAELVESDPTRFFVPPYVGHRGWIGVRLDIEPDWEEIDQILREAYRVAAPKTLVRLLDAQSSQAGS